MDTRRKLCNAPLPEYLWQQSKTLIILSNICDKITGFICRGGVNQIHTRHCRLGGAIDG
jgi:hypothetical protein